MTVRWTVRTATAFDNKESARTYFERAQSLDPSTKIAFELELLK